MSAAGSFAYENSCDKKSHDFGAAGNLGGSNVEHGPPPPPPIRLLRFVLLPSCFALFAFISCLAHVLIWPPLGVFYIMLRRYVLPPVYCNGIMLEVDFVRRYWLMSLVLCDGTTAILSTADPLSASFPDRLAGVCSRSRGLNNLGIRRCRGLKFLYMFY